MTVIFFTNRDGECSEVESALKSNGICYDRVDCTTAEGEDYADTYRVEELPCVLMYDDDEEEVLRLESLSDIETYMDELRG